MSRFISYLFRAILCTVILFALFVGALACYPAAVFSDTYQSVLQRKYDALVETDTPKIVIIGGSSAGFGINEAVLEEATGYSVVNLGLHAGFGAVVPTELSKANINEGDIVLLAYEYGWYEPGYFKSFGTDLVMSGIDHRIDMYRYLPAEHYPKLLGYLFEYAEKKRTDVTTSGVYSSESFDMQGRMILNRPVMTMEYVGNEHIYGSIDTTNAVLASDVAGYLTEYKAFVEQKGASIYFIAPPLYEGAFQGDQESLSLIARIATEELGIPYISNPSEYLFSAEYMYDTIYHCNTAGELRRTEQIVQDLVSVGILN